MMVWGIHAVGHEHVRFSILTGKPFVLHIQNLSFGPGKPVHKEINLGARVLHDKVTQYIPIYIVCTVNEKINIDVSTNNTSARKNALACGQTELLTECIIPT
jgi:hypothetical protein